jgi:hypothetical protein
LIYAATATLSLYLNVFVGVVQAFQKISFLQPLRADTVGAAVRRCAGTRAGDISRTHGPGVEAAAGTLGILP